MRKHASAVIASVKDDRKRGFSVSELMQKYSLPKTTVWHYVHSIRLSDTLGARIRSRQGGSAKRSKEGWEEAKRQAAFLLKGFKEETAWPVLFAALYWSEGTKKSGFVFTNTDPSMIRVFLKALRRKLGVKDGDIDILIRTCAPMDQAACRKHWAKITDTPIHKIRINHHAQNKSKTTYGMCRITVRKGGKYLKLAHCLIQELTGKILAVA
ncbi:MAG TPA: hypothetical protein VHD55_00270 [Candidatus Paceibacterota bacterium]|nr:hypothetical protein [Candidatus Paceibacterota bacterium]